MKFIIEFDQKQSSKRNTGQLLLHPSWGLLQPSWELVNSHKSLFDTVQLFGANFHALNIYRTALIENIGQKWTEYQNGNLFSFIVEWLFYMNHTKFKNGSPNQGVHCVKDTNQLPNYQRSFQSLRFTSLTWCCLGSSFWTPGSSREDPKSFPARDMTVLKDSKNTFTICYFNSHYAFLVLISQVENWFKKINFSLGISVL